MSKRLIKKQSFLLLLVFFLLWTSCGDQKRWYEATFFYFDTICEVKLFTSHSLFNRAQEDIQGIFFDIDRCFSPGAEDYSSPMVLSLFRKAAALHKASSGAFDITVAPLSRLWGFLDGNPRIPEPEHVKKTLKFIGMEKIQDKKTFLDLPEGLALDWGGIAKGFGIDLAARSLINIGIHNGFINAGGDLYCWGKNPDNASWKIGIKHPREGGFVGLLEIADLGAATAGDYQRFFIEDGIRYHHIFDPKTGYPAQGKQSVTVVGPETFLCDALSTALFVSDSPEKILKKYPEYGALIIKENGSLLRIGKEYFLTYSR